MLDFSAKVPDGMFRDSIVLNINGENVHLPFGKHSNFGSYQACLNINANATVAPSNYTQINGRHSIMQLAAYAPNDTNSLRDLSFGHLDKLSTDYKVSLATFGFIFSSM